MKAQPYFKTLKMDSAFELRHYHPSLMMRVQLRGPFETAFKQGASLFNDYVAGNNYKKERIISSSPVLLSSRPEGWEVSCFMPWGLNFTDMPRPMGEHLQFQELPEREVVVIKFHGKSAYPSMMRKTEELKNWAIGSGVPVASGSSIVVYQSPILPFMRRNEIHFNAQ